MSFSLNAKNKNRLPFTYGADLTGFQVIFRAKNTVEDTTTPIVEVLATITSTTASLSVGYIDVDLTAVTTLGNTFFFEIEINDGATINATPTTPPIFTVQPTKGTLITRLDN